MQSGEGKPSLYWSFCSSLESIWPQESSRHKSFPWKMVLDPLFSRLLFVCNGHKAPAVERWAGWGSVIQVSELIRAHLNRSTMQTPNNLRLQQTKVLIFQFHVFQSIITKSSTMNQWNSHQFRVKAAAADFATSETTPVMPLIRSKFYWGPFRRLMSEMFMENWREKSRAKKIGPRDPGRTDTKKDFSPDRTFIYCKQNLWLLLLDSSFMSAFILVTIWFLTILQILWIASRQKQRRVKLNLIQTQGLKHEAGFLLVEVGIWSHLFTHFAQRQPVVKREVDTQSWWGSALQSSSWKKSTVLWIQPKGVPQISFRSFGWLGMRDLHRTDFWTLALSTSVNLRNVPEKGGSTWLQAMSAWDIVLRSHSDTYETSLKPTKQRTFVYAGQGNFRKTWLGIEETQDGKKHRGSRLTNVSSYSPWLL